MDTNDLLKDVFSDLMSTPTNGQPAIGDPIVDSSPDPVQSTQVNSQTSTEQSVVNDTIQSDATEPESTTPEQTDDDLSWDSYVDDGQTTQTQSTEIDFSQIGKAIGVELKSVDELTKFVSDLKTENSELKTKSLNTEELPSDLKDAIEIWKNQGDYHSIFDVEAIDYSVLDPVELFEQEVEEFFVNPDGTFREKEYWAYVDSLDETDKRLRGMQIQKQLIAEQTYQKQAIKQKVERERTENLRNLEQTINKFDKVGDYTVTPKVRQELYQDIASGKFLEKMGVSLNGSHKFETLLNMYFKAKYFDAIQKFNSDRTRNSTLRKEVEKVGNHTVNNAPRVGNPVESQKKDPVSMYFDAKGIKR
jgi:hypothetical protein